MAIKKILVITWEYPPKSSSVAQSCERLVKGLAKKFHVDVITWDDWRAHMGFEDRADARIHYISPSITAHNTITFFMTLNMEFERIATSIFHNSPITPGLIHVHEWISLPAGLCLKKIYDTPLFLSLYSLEDTRSPGGTSPFNESIKSIERKGIHEATKIIVVSESLKDEVIRIYGCPEERICVITPHGSMSDQILKIYKDVLETSPFPSTSRSG